MAFDVRALVWLALTAGLAALVVALLIPPLMPIFRRYAMARPSARGSHAEPIPQGGGVPIIAVVVGLCALGWLMGGFNSSPPEVSRYYWLVLLAAIALALLGACDDIRPMRPAPRLAIQGAVAALVVLLAPADWRIAPALPVWIERPVLVVGFMWMINLTNFMDGIDGIVVAEGVPIGVAIALIASADILASEAGVIAAALAGGLAGFYIYNRSPARLFLGDVGSLPIGFLLAAMLFELGSRKLAAALLLPLYFVFDATLTLCLGLIRRQNVTAPHRRHAYQRAFDAGWRARSIAGVVAAVNVALIALAFAALSAGRTTADVLTLAVGLAIVALVIRRFRTAGRA